MNRITPFFLVILLGGGLLVGCGQQKRAASPEKVSVSESRILSLYDQLRSGMTKDEVKTIAGKPLSLQPLRDANGEEDCFYISEREETYIEPHVSPWGFSGLVITYKDGRLIRKKYNPQWVKREHLDRHGEPLTQ